MFWSIIQQPFNLQICLFYTLSLKMYIPNCDWKSQPSGIFTEPLNPCSTPPDFYFCPRIPVWGWGEGLTCLASAWNGFYLWLKYWTKSWSAFISWEKRKINFSLTDKILTPSRNPTVFRSLCKRQGLADLKQKQNKLLFFPTKWCRRWFKRQTDSFMF